MRAKRASETRQSECEQSEQANPAKAHASKASKRNPPKRMRAKRASKPRQSVCEQSERANRVATGVDARKGALGLRNSEWAPYLASRRAGELTASRSKPSVPRKNFHSNEKDLPATAKTSIPMETTFLSKSFN